MIARSGVIRTRLRVIFVWDYLEAEDTGCVTFFMTDGELEDEVTFTRDQVGESVYTLKEPSLLVVDLLNLEYARRSGCSKRGKFAVAKDIR